MKNGKISSLFLLSFLVMNFYSIAQSQDSASVSPWSQSLDLNFYLYNNDFFTVPVYEIDKDHLHLEAHYNYEARNTFSAWYGYNFKGGKDFSYLITPMAGIVFGEVNGLAPGLELTFTYKKFLFVSDSEYVFDLEQQADDYFYVWSELSYLPNDWLELGISYQRTRLRDEKIEFQGGAFIGGNYKWFQLTGYVYFGQDDPFGLLTLTINYPDN
jgi:hypothetical protein